MLSLVKLTTAQKGPVVTAATIHLDFWFTDFSTDISSLESYMYLVISALNLLKNSSGDLFIFLIFFSQIVRVLSIWATYLFMHLLNSYLLSTS